MDLQNQSLDHDLIRETSSDPHERVAKMGKRFLNLIIDTIAFYILMAILGGIIAVTAGVSPLTSILMYYVIFFFIYFAYYAGMEATTGKTLGKMLTKTSVVTNTGEKITWGKAFGRAACRLIPFEPFSFLSSNPIGWHDSITGTLVVTDN